MSFGGASFDSRADALILPTRSMITGLIGNAIGLSRGDGRALNRIQASLDMAIAVVERGSLSVDFQTSDLQKSHMVGPMWTTLGKAFQREGSADAMERAVRHTPYIADGHYVCLVRLRQPSEWALVEILDALQMPVRPLYLGRAAYMPAAPIGHSIIVADTVDEALDASGFVAKEIWVNQEPEDGGLVTYDLAGTRDFVTYTHVGIDTFWRVR